MVLLLYKKQEQESKKRSAEACTRCSRLLLLPGVPAAVYSFAAVLVRGRGARGKRSSKRRVNALLSMLHDERCTSEKEKEGTADDERRLSRC